MSEAIYANTQMNNEVETDRGEMAEMVVDIYDSSDTLRDEDTRTTTHETEDTDLHNVPGDLNSDNITINNSEKKWNNQLQTSYNNMTRERVQLQTMLSVLETHFQEGWRYFGSSLYFLSAEQKTWYESRQDCQRRNADLVIINSEEEQKLISGLKMRFWIGLTDKDEEGTWKWVDGTKLTTGYWLSGQPDNFQSQEDCAEIYIWDNKRLELWNDLNCETKRNWICEKMLNNPLTHSY
ncbi:C-type lectin domain family 4 member E-like isoform X2 [Esox lucius]|uniref:C-type lectin domain family 4 member E-like isoform X2 n=1 Tax=Esox lucius TaxID=8010 RepID=UPI0014768685|nr:C-type lectin domain family 4 member E-like isoform X2 [Esox lucius]